MDMQMQRVRSLVAAMIGAGAVAVLAGSAGAAPILVDASAFSPSATLVTFDGTLLPNGGLITNEFSGQGVTFSGGLYLTYLNGHPSPSAQNYPLFAPTQAQPITIDFSTTMLRAGFDVQSANIDNISINVQAYSGDMLVSTGMFVFDSGTTWRFAGVEDSMNGIDRLVLTGVGTSGTNAFAIDNLRFEPVAVIPEPSAALLFPVGLMLAASQIRGRRPRIA